MFRNILAMNSMNSSKKAANLGLNPIDAFSECADFEAQFIGNPVVKPVKKDDFICIIGSCMLAAKGDYEVINALPTDVDGSLNYVKSKPVKNALVSLGTVTGNNIPLEPVTKVKCLTEGGCRIQYMIIEPSFYINLKNEVFGKSMDVTMGVKSIVSTSKKGKLDLDAYVTGKTDQRTYIKTVTDTTNLIIATPDLKVVTYNRDKYIDFALNELPNPYNNHQSRSGTLNESTIFYIKTGMNYHEIQGKVSPDAETITETISGSSTFEWKPVKEGSDSANQTEWYFPEFTATLSTKGGVFTKENANQKYTGHNSLSQTMIIIIAASAVVFVMVIVAVAILLYMKAKRKEDKSNFTPFDIQ